LLANWHPGVNRCQAVLRAFPFVMGTVRPQET
jgi:hypothetical protein